MLTKLAACLIAVLWLTGCPAEETNNGADVGPDLSDDNPAECPKSPPTEATACETEGIACSYSADCPCGPREEFVWNCTAGELVGPASLSCSTGTAADCPNMTTNNLTPGDMEMGDVPIADVGPVDMGVDAPVDMARARVVAHGCTYETALDMTGNAVLVITDLLPWDLTHTNYCIIVDAGTVVTWNGDFTAHPLDGGVSPTENPNSPITIAAADANGDDTVDVTFVTLSDYPYFCSIHTGIMRGVIYVD